MANLIRLGADSKPTLSKKRIAVELGVAGAGALAGYTLAGKRHPVAGVLLGWLGGRLLTSMFVFEG
jgi:hypothetical protein